jgi:hypothetical protein
MYCLILDLIVCIVMIVEELVRQLALYSIKKVKIIQKGGPKVPRSLTVPTPHLHNILNSRKHLRFFQYLH